MGIYLSSPKSEKTTEQGSNNQLSWIAMSMQGWRTQMEDSHIAQTGLPGDVSVFGVFDGHGGAEVAQYVKKHFIETLIKNENFKNKNYKVALIENFIKMDEMMQSYEGIQEIKSYTQYDDQESHAGCTANVVLLTKTEIYCANSGDSRSVLRQKKDGIPLSFDHKPDNPEEKQRVMNAGGFVSDGRINGNLNLSRAMGDLEYKRDRNLPPEQQIISVVPDVLQRKISENDKFIIMGCDGIWEIMSNQEVTDYINERIDKQLPQEQILSEFLDKNLAKDTSNGAGCDNMSAILLIFKK